MRGAPTGGEQRRNESGESSRAARTALARRHRKEADDRAAYILTEDCVIDLIRPLPVSLLDAAFPEKLRKIR